MNSGFCDSRLMNNSLIPNCRNIIFVTLGILSASSFLLISPFIPNSRSFLIMRVFLNNFRRLLFVLTPRIVIASFMAAPMLTNFIFLHCYGCTLI